MGNSVKRTIEPINKAEKIEVSDDAWGLRDAILELTAAITRLAEKIK